MSEAIIHNHARKHRKTSNMHKKEKTLKSEPLSVDQQQEILIEPEKTMLAKLGPHHSLIKSTWLSTETKSLASPMIQSSSQKKKQTDYGILIRML